MATAGPVATVTLDRPEVLNAFDAPMVDALLRVLGALADDDDVRAVVLTGAGRGFCAGADVASLVEMTGGFDTTPARLQQVMLDGNGGLAQALWNFPTPVVAAVNGPAAGAGAAMALSCDAVVCASSASLVFAFVHRGLVPDFATTWLLPRLVGLRLARRLLLTGARVPAAEALAIGLVDDVVADEDLPAAAAALAQTLAEGPAVALRLTKHLLGRAFEIDHATAVHDEFTAQALCFTTADAAEGALSFQQRRPPQFTGR